MSINMLWRFLELKDLLLELDFLSKKISAYKWQPTLDKPTISTQLQLWLFCCWGCGCCWAVTIISLFERVSILVLDKTLVSNQSPMISSNFDFILSFDELVRVRRGSSWCIFQFLTNPRLKSKSRHMTGFSLKSDFPTTHTKPAT